MTDTSVAQAAAKPVYYLRVELDNQQDPTRLDLVRGHQSPTPPEAMRVLVRNIQDVSRVISTVFSFDKTLRRALFLQLHVTADTGLRGADFDVDSGLDNLAEVKSNIADQFPTVRTYFWKRYGLMC